MAIITINGIFYIITSRYMFPLSLSHLQAEVLFT